MKIVKEIVDIQLLAPLAEPLIRWYNDGFVATRIKDDNEIVWYGFEINWKFFNGKWHRLGTDENVKPIESKYPDIVYPVERSIWIECSTPLYEQIYQKLKREY